MNSQHRHFFEFDCFRLDPLEHILLRDGELVPLTPKAFETLLVLVDNNGHVVDKDELYKRVWADAVVEETNLTKNISVLRKVLGENDSEKSYIETVPKRGYRFVAPVKEIETVSPEIKSKSILSARKKVGLIASIAALSALLAFVGYWQFSDKSKDEKTASS